MEICFHENRVVPHLVQILSAQLKANAMCVGILRVNGNLQNINEYSKKINNFELDDLKAQNINVYDVASLYKQYYKQLPQRLIKAWMVPHLLHHL